MSLVEKNGHGSADLHTPINPPPLILLLKRCEKRITWYTTVFPESQCSSFNQSSDGFYSQWNSTFRIYKSYGLAGGGASITCGHICISSYRVSAMNFFLRTCNKSLCYSCCCCSFLWFQFLAVLAKLCLPGQMMKGCCSMCLDLRPFTSSTQRARQLCRRSKLKVFVPNQTTDTPGNISLLGVLMKQYELHLRYPPFCTPPALLIPHDFFGAFWLVESN